MDDEARDRLEVRLRALARAGDLTAAATEAVRGYGPELLGFLVGLARDRSRGEELFAAFCERMWRALPGFRWDSSLRVWAYKLARHLFIDSTRGRAGVRDLPLSAVPEPEAVRAEARSTTAAYQRTDAKDALAEARARLDPEDQMLLGLRVEHEMGWRDIARVLGHPDAELDRHAAALRKRFERLKAKLQRELLE